MSAPLASTSSTPLVAFAQDVDYSGTEGFKQFKVIYNQKNARCARNDPHGSYSTALALGVRGPGNQQKHLEYIVGSG